MISPKPRRSKSIEPLVAFSSADFTPWLHLLEEASGKYRADQELEYFESSLRFTAENRYFRELRRNGGPLRAYALCHFLAGSTQASDGMLLQRSHGDEGSDLKELPTPREISEDDSADCLEL